MNCCPRGLATTQSGHLIMNPVYRRETTVHDHQAICAGNCGLISRAGHVFFPTDSISPAEERLKFRFAELPAALAVLRAMEE